MILVCAILGALIGTCTASFSNSKPFTDLLCPDHVWDMEEKGTITRKEIYNAMERYNCEWETQQEAIDRETWTPTNHTPYIIIMALVGAATGAIIGIKRAQPAP